MLRLRLPIYDIKDGVSDYEISVEPNALELEYAEVEFRSPVISQFHIRKSGFELEISATVKTVLRLLCARCLSLFDGPFESKFKLFIKLEQGGPAMADFADEDFAFLDSNNGFIDFAGRIRAEILLEIPRIPLCKSDCSGIEYAGKETPVEKVEVDDRWAALKQVKLKKETKKKTTERGIYGSPKA